MDGSTTDPPHPVQSTEPINQEVPAPAEAPAAGFIGAQEDEIQGDDDSSLPDSTDDDSNPSMRDDVRNPCQAIH